MAVIALYLFPRTRHQPRDVRPIFTLSGWYSSLDDGALFSACAYLSRFTISPAAQRRSCWRCCCRARRRNSRYARCSHCRHWAPKQEKGTMRCKVAVPTSLSNGFVPPRKSHALYFEEGSFALLCGSLPNNL